jgi:ElaB/YqjD/DUF883 family membrane-anchored ribosome-binding protein
MAERTNLALGKQIDTSGDRNAEEIRRDIATTRDSIKDTVERLNDRVEMALDWKTYVADSPFVALSAAAGVGFFLSRVFRPRPTPRERMFDALADSVEDFTGQVREQLSRLPVQRVSAGRVVKSAAAALVTQAVTAYVRAKFLPRPDAAISSATPSIESRHKNG